LSSSSRRRVDGPVLFLRFAGGVPCGDTAVKGASRRLAVAVGAPVRVYVGAVFLDRPDRYYMSRLTWWRDAAGASGATRSARRGLRGAAIRSLRSAGGIPCEDTAVKGASRRLTVAVGATRMVYVGAVCLDRPLVW